jgi:hypothetical protein
MAVERGEVLAEVRGREQFFARFAKDGKIPEEMRHEHYLLVKRLERGPEIWEVPRK